MEQVDELAVNSPVVSLFLKKNSRVKLCRHCRKRLDGTLKEQQENFQMI